MTMKSRAKIKSCHQSIAQMPETTELQLCLCLHLTKFPARLYLGWKNIFRNLDKYVLHFGSFFFAFLKNAFWNSTQLLLQLCLCLHLTKFLASLTKLGLKKLQTLQKPISFCILSCTQHQASIGFVFLCPHFYAHIYFFLHNSPCSASK